MRTVLIQLRPQQTQTIEETQTQTMVDTITYVSTATATDYETATVTSVSISTYIDPTTYFSTVLSTRVIDNVGVPSYATFALMLISSTRRPRPSSIP